MATTGDHTPLPVVDLKKARDPKFRLAVAKQLVEALETVGFLFVDNVEGFDPEKLLNMTQWFFNLSQQEKNKVARKIWNSESHNYYRGYFPTQGGEASFKEGFEVGEDSPPQEDKAIHPFFTEANLWPKEVQGAPQFREDMRRFFSVFLEAGTEILRLISLGCGLEENWFESMFVPHSLSTLRLLHYPPRPAGVEIPETARDGDTVLCCSKHSDSGFVTLLATFHYGGLQVWRGGKEGGSQCGWMEVPPRPSSLVMNVGDMMSAMSGGRVKATVHRVVDTNADRFSVPFFFEPRYDADVTRVMPTVSEGDARARVRSGASAMEVKPGCETYGPYLIDKMRGFAEYKDILMGDAVSQAHA
ncbi:uncharacterized protein LOC143294767 [Babylonia areolata]|uniref:uncharacterized protein LOC143294767 n=1 Tax=Babylonia areolata TaxID=304850 RepID=UPI003FD4963B